MSTVQENGPQGAPASDSLERVLETVRRNVTALYEGAPHPPSTIRLTVGDVALEMAWSQPPAPGGTVRSPAPQPAQPAQAGAPEVSERPSSTAGTPGDERGYLCAAMVGTFYRAPEPGATPFVREGDPVAPGQQVAIIEAMKLMVPVVAELGGRVAEVLVEDGTPVEYGQRLIALLPAGAGDENR